MGIKAAHKFIKDSGYEPKATEIESFPEDTRFHVDLLGCFFSLFRAAFFKYEPKVAAGVVLKSLSAKLPKDSSIIYLDGGKTVEKERTIKLRAKTEEKKKKKFVTHFQAMEKAVEEGGRVSGAKIRKAYELAINSFKLSESRKQIFRSQAELDGWKVVACQGEADITLGGASLSNQDIVLSGDSDLLFYPNIIRVLRPFKRGIFHLYDKSDMLKTLKLSLVQWQCLALVSGNDYEPNINGMGIFVNAKILRRIKKDSLQDTLSSYLENDQVKEKNKTNLTFKTAFKVFGTMTQQLSAAKSDDEQLINRKDIVVRLSKIRRSAKNKRKEKKLKKGNVIEQRHPSQVVGLRQVRKWRFNTCRPIEHEPSAELCNLHKGRRYAHKRFIEFKKPALLQKGGYEMFTADPSDKRKKVKAKRKQQRSKADKSGRHTRLRHQDQPKKSRKVSDMRRKTLQLNKKHPTIVINAGDLKSNINKVTTPNVGPTVLDELQALVKNMNTTKRFAQLATDLFFMAVLERLPLKDGAHKLNRKKWFETVLYGKAAGTHYFQALLGLIAREDCPSDHLRRFSVQFLETLLDGCDESMPDAEKADDGDEVMEDIKEKEGNKKEEDDDDDAEKDYEDEKDEEDHETEDDDNLSADTDEGQTGSTLSVPTKYVDPADPVASAMLAYQLLKDCHPNYKGSCAISSRSIEMLSRALDKEFASHFKGRIPLLLEKLEQQKEEEPREGASTEGERTSSKEEGSTCTL